MSDAKDSENDQSEKREKTEKPRPESADIGADRDPHRLSRHGSSLYLLMDLPKTATKADIKRKYRRLALKYHPDKNPNNPEAEEIFKKVNYAHSVLTDDRKREIYDKYGSFGLYIGEQFGEEIVEKVMIFQSKWFQCIFWSCCFLSGFYCLCCCCCCCCCCCGTCRPPMKEEYMPNITDLENLDDEAFEELPSPEVERAVRDPIIHAAQSRHSIDNKVEQEEQLKYYGMGNVNKDDEVMSGSASRSDTTVTTQPTSSGTPGFSSSRTTTEPDEQTSLKESSDGSPNGNYGSQN